MVDRNDKHHKRNEGTWEEHEVPLSQLGRFPTCSLDFLLGCVGIGGSKSLLHFQKIYPIVSLLSRSFNMSFLNYLFTHQKNSHVWRLPFLPLVTWEGHFAFLNESFHPDYLPSDTLQGFRPPIVRMTPRDIIPKPRLVRAALLNIAVTSHMPILHLNLNKIKLSCTSQMKMLSRHTG